MKIGFIGQGFIGGNLADNFEERGYADIVRYDNDKFAENKDALASCDVIFVAVPTPTTKDGFDDSILQEVAEIPPSGCTVLIKSTVLPETMRSLQEKYPKKTFMHCPEFLSEDTAKKDTDEPERNIIGVSDTKDEGLVLLAGTIMAILPKAKHETVCTYEESTLVKYIGNCFFFAKNNFFNMMYNLCNKYDCEWEKVREIVLGDSRIHPVHTNPIDKNGRGAGGHCLIKDFAALLEMYKQKVPEDIFAPTVLGHMQASNSRLLIITHKDIDLLKGVIGEETFNNISEDIVKGVK